MGVFIAEAGTAAALFVRFRVDTRSSSIMVVLSNKAGEEAIVTKVYEKNYYFFVDPKDPEAHKRAARREHVPLPDDLRNADCRYLGRGEMSEEEIEMLVSVAKTMPSITKARRIAHRILSTG